MSNFNCAMEIFKSEIEIVEEVLSILESSPKIKERYMGMISVLYDRKQRALHHLYRMGVIGITSCGKSTLVNSFLHEDLLPSGVQPSSSQLVSCRRGNSRKATVFFTDRTPEMLKSSGLSSQLIADYADERKNPKNVKHVKQIGILSPLFPFDSDLVLVDSPGLDAYKLEGHEKLTLSTLLPSVDFCLFITTCKTNSDKKTAEVLNQIAEYEKEVIVVQNMIDSIQPSLNVDGSIRKDKAEVAKEHMRRVRNIIELSKIKSSVPIIQYSAIWARNAQTNRDKELLVKSGYENLVGQINKLFVDLRPKVELNRIRLVKQDIEHLIHDAEIDGAGYSYPVAPFKYDGVIDKLNAGFMKKMSQIKQELEVLDNMASEVNKQSRVSERDVNHAKETCSKCVSRITSLQKEVYDQIKRYSESLAVTVDQLYNETEFPQLSNPTLRYDTVTNVEWKEKKGFFNSVKRGFGALLGNESWGREQNVTRQKVLNVDESKQVIIRYLQNAEGIYKSLLENWYKKNVKVISCLQSQVSKYRQEYEDRLQSTLESRIYLEIADKLRGLLSRIPQSESSTRAYASTDHAGMNVLYKTEIPKLSYDVFKLANVVNNRAHKVVFDRLLAVSANRDSFILGWDLPCLQHFLQHSFGRTMNGGYDTFACHGNDFQVYYNVLGMDRVKRLSFSPANVFVLLSALQHGQALTLLNRIKLHSFLHKADNLFLVVQDFEEIVNADVVEEALGNLLEVQHTLSLQGKLTVFLMHENVVYNLAALETQRRKGKNPVLLHNDELCILSDLRSSVFRSQCVSPCVANTIMKIIKSLK